MIESTALWVLFANALGFFFLALAVGYLYRPEAIARVYAVLRRVLFNEEHVALHHRRWGLFFLLLSLFAFYLGNFA